MVSIGEREKKNNKKKKREKEKKREKASCCLQEEICIFAQYTSGPETVTLMMCFSSTLKAIFCLLVPT